MRALKSKSASRRAGIQVSNGRNGFLTNLRFADDILLIGRSLPGVRRMLEELIDEAEKFGLEAHMGKTKILSNSIGKACHLRHTVVGHSEIKILGPEAGTMYFGQIFELGRAT